MSAPGDTQDAHRTLAHLRQRVAGLESENTRLAGENEQLTRHIFGEAPVMYILLGDRADQPVIGDCNTLFLQALGYNRDEVVGRLLVDFYTPASREQLFSSGGYQKTRQGGIFEAERQLVTRDGRVIETLLRATPGCAMFVDVTERKRLERSLAENQRALSTLMSNLPGMVYRCRNDRDRTMEFVSEGCRELTGYAPDDLIENRHIAYGRLVHEKDRDIVRQKIQSALRTQEPFRITYRIKPAAGQERWVWEQGRGISAAPGEDQCVEGFITDITDRIRVEEAQRKTNRMLRLLSECNQALVRAQDESALMTDICRNIVEIGGYRMAWVGYVETDDAKTIRPVAQWGYEKGYLDTLKVSWGDNERGSGPSGRAIRNKEPVVIQNILTDPDYALWRGEALKQGYGSTIGLPLLDAVHPLGVLRIYDGDPDAFDPEEVRLLTELANDLAYGIQALRTREAHLKAESELRESAFRLQVMHEIDRGILEAESTEEIARTAVEHIGKVVPCTRAEVCVLDFEQGRADLLALHSRDEARESERYSLPLHEFGDIDVLGQGEPRRVDDIRTLSTQPVYLRLLAPEGVRSYVKVPLLVQEDLIGSFNLVSNRPRAFTGQHISLVREVADQLSIAIQHAGLYRQVRLHAKKLERSVKALQESEERLRVLVETLPEGVCLLNEEGAVVMANTAAKDYFVLLVGNGKAERITELAGQPLEEFLELYDDGEFHEVTVKGPPRQIFDIAARPVEVENGGTGWVLVMRDITHQRETEQRIQEQYRLASVGQLAAGIAHDFNNMLTVMMGTAQLLDLNPATPDPLKTDLKTICEQGQRASHLVRQILDFSRKTVIQRQPLNIVPLLKESAKLLAKTIPENIEIKIECDHADYTVTANPTQLQQVITNLAINARDAMPRGGTFTIHLSAMNIGEGAQAPLPEMAPGRWLAWRVSDTGTGIDPGILTHIFEPFFTTKQPGKGTGLGLSQVYGIVKQHGGEIAVDSKLNEGATFTIYLPLSKQTPIKPASSAESVPWGQGETILVVEDEPGVLKVARNFLENLNYKVLAALNGKDALKLYSQHRGEIQLVITDMVMPEMGGEELFMELKKRDPHIKVIVMTGYATGTEEDATLLDQAAGRLGKPLTLNHVAEVVGRALRVENSA